jgi:hypothetical protein
MKGYSAARQLVEGGVVLYSVPCSNTDGMEVRSVGNSQTLKETALIEAFNLKVGGREVPAGMPVAAC